jgi:alkylhydroperoxidase family enzyme
VRDRARADRYDRKGDKVTDEDIAAARASGLSEDEIFEFVVCAAIGQATRQYNAALAALDAVTRRS